MIVPSLGGAPAVWIVCSLCFQALLLAGYGYAHVLTTRLPLRAQLVVHLVAIGSAFLVLPIAIDDRTVERLTSGHPTIGLLVVLIRAVGLPFFVLSTTSPLLQRWCAELGDRDPYHLYAASNAGSMLALLGYPLLVEPSLAVKEQSRALQGGFVAYALLVALSAAFTARGRRAPAAVDTPPDDVGPPARGESKWRERLIWGGLAFVPSTLLLGATEYITTDIASVPLLWVLPLALYLLSFIVAFAKRQVVPPRVASRATALIAALVVALTLANVAGPAWLVVGAHVLLLFVGSVVCHRALAERRPPAARLTELYLSISIGGVLGGVVNGLVAPFVFDDLFEYPVAIGLVCLARAALERAPAPATRREIGRDVVLGAALGGVTWGLVKLGAALKADPQSSFVWMFGAPLVVAYVWSKRPVRYAVAIAGLLLAGMSHGGFRGTTLWSHRGFFGVLQVTREREGRFELLVSGRTMHGKQALAPEARHVPLAYYHPTGPAGDFLGPLPTPAPTPSLAPRRVGVIGLGAGALAAYARPGDAWTFFEIDPAVVEVARTRFGFLQRAEAHATVAVETGDARLRLRQGEAARFDVLVLDAFSSDAVPVHLVTREALAVYRRALAPGGALLVHVSNNHVRLAPVFAALARDAGLVAIGRNDADVDAAERTAGKEASEWLVLTASREGIDLLLRTKKGWGPLAPPARARVWTDDYADVLGALQF
ncbi:MAG: fused MFS/spermidine synthase [Labilithrix sp.]|nr:fused MFS/spermidine synthase [Labilithrix sp.]